MQKEPVERKEALLDNYVNNVIMKGQLWNVKNWFFMLCLKIRYYFAMKQCLFSGFQSWAYSIMYWCLEWPLSVIQELFEAPGIK